MTPRFSLPPHTTHRCPVQATGGTLRPWLVAAVAALGAASAGASVVSLPQTLSFSTTVAPMVSSSTLITPLALSQFDPTLGTLQGVSFRVALAAFDLTLTLDGYDTSSGGDFISASLNGGQYSVSKSLPGGGGNLFATVSGGGGTIFSESEPLHFSSSAPVLRSQDATSTLQTAGTFTDFIGTGSVPGVAWGYFFFSNSGSTVDLQVGPDTIQVEANVGVSQSAGPATLYVDYSYAAAAVPEPASVAMMLAGLGLLAGLVRRRARA